MSNIISECTNFDDRTGEVEFKSIQHVTPCIVDNAHKRMHDKQQGKEGLGMMYASIPVVEILKMRNEHNIDIVKDSDARKKFLRKHPEYCTYKQTGRSGKIIIK